MLRLVGIVGLEPTEGINPDDLQSSAIAAMRYSHKIKQDTFFYFGYSFFVAVCILKLANTFIQSIFTIIYLEYIIIYRSDLPILIRNLRLRKDSNLYTSDVFPRGFTS